MFNFSWMAQATTSKHPRLYGLLPNFSTMLALLVASAAIAGGLWVWSFGLAFTAAFLPLFAKTVAAVVGMTALNFWFSREINTFMFSTREVRENFKFDEHNPTDLRKLVNQVRCEVNAHFKKVYGDKHQDIPMPRLLTFTDHHFKMVTVEGRNPGKAAILFSSGALNSHDTNLNQRHMAALVAMQLVKIYHRRSLGGTLVGMGLDLVNTLENARSGNLFYRVIGFLIWPLQFFLLLQRAIKRSYEYDAALTVVDMGRGMDLIDAIDFKVCPVLFEKPTYRRLAEDQASKKRSEYNGPFASWVRWFTNWIDKQEYAGDDKTGWRILSAIDAIVRELGFFINELFDPNPRSTNLKTPMRQAIPGYEQASNQADLDRLYARDREINRDLYKEIAKKDRYEVIGPDGSGVVKSAHAHEHSHKLKEKITRLEKAIAQLSKGRVASKPTKGGAPITTQHARGKASTKVQPHQVADSAKRAAKPTSKRHH
ncbi:hypothetical protein [Candidatus Berkiella aquae]|uniref:Uncharacterized protein n=1 Tax=Candidatus Berkiella aquae TaxID=295108 RepID=A0A0Q9YZH0_9GAMM|nr:hypothetical protein [Candidatus Berkiella aquae]MCS5712630.1 hypothetical protein [Candidatus Berkiella aquae]